MKGPDDWRISFFGDTIYQTATGSLLESITRTSRGDIEESGGGRSDDDKGKSYSSNQRRRCYALIPTMEALTERHYDFIAIYFGSYSCPSCRSFTPRLLQSLPFLERQRCKVIFISTDKDERGYHESMGVVSGSLDAMPYNPSQTQMLRDWFRCSKVPSLIIVTNDAMKHSDPTVLCSDARYFLVDDPECSKFPWSNSSTASGVAGGGGSSMPTNALYLSPGDRWLIRGKYGSWWHYGHRNINPMNPTEPYMDDHAVRARAGILHIITWIALMNVLFWPEKLIFATYFFPIVFWEFLSSMIWGLTPVAPIGVIGTSLAILLQPKPSWTPARPKRFAWLIGLTLSSTCFTGFILRERLGKAFLPMMLTVTVTCNLATWLECSMGFCVGCFMFNYMLVPLFGWKPCVECQ